MLGSSWGANSGEEVEKIKKTVKNRYVRTNAVKAGHRRAYKRNFSGVK